jgi:predicted metal-dependent hydrolase
VGELDRIARTIKESLDNSQAEFKRTVQGIGAASRKASESELARIADSLELLAAAEAHRNPIKLAADEDEIAVEWLGRQEAHQCPICRRAAQETAERATLEQASEFLTEQLKDGERLLTEVYAKADDIGISKRSLRDAAKEIGVVTVQRDGALAWSLATAAGAVEKDAGIRLTRCGQYEPISFRPAMRMALTMAVNSPSAHADD